MGVQINGATGNVIATKGTFSGNVGIAGTLTYEDVTDIDAVGLITARSGIEVGASPGVGASISRQGNAIFSGITTIGSKEVGAGITLSPDGHVSVSGVTTSSTIHIGVDTGVYGENLVVTGDSRVTGIASFGTSDNPAMHVNIGMSTLSAAPVLTVPDMIKHSGDPETRVRFDTGTVKVETTQIERLRIGSSGQIGLNGANYGSSGQVLTSQGSSAAPQWATAAAGITMMDQWRISNDNNKTNNEIIDSNWERNDDSPFSQIGTGMTESSGVFTFPQTGIYFILAQIQMYGGASVSYSGIRIKSSSDGGGSYDTISYALQNPDGYSGLTAHAIVDVTNASNFRLYLQAANNSSTQYSGSSTYHRTGITFIRLGDT